MLRFLLTLARHLDLLGEHALGYAELIRAECAVSLRCWVWRVAAFAAAALFVLIGLVSAAVVLALWSNGIDVASWRAWVVPLVCLLVALACVAFALTRRPPPMSEALMQQLQRDIDLLRAARGGAKTDEAAP
ncbi:MAG: phage holin family protein [Rudaea sp.]|uniref:phage holin family protein n=1 Tax=Rudaea sp. TaxID=2136325 RepID=UPI0039E527FB